MDLARKLGADVVVDGRNGDIATLHALSRPRVWRPFLPAGGDGLRAVRRLRSGGRLAYPTGIASAGAAFGITITPYDAIRAAGRADAAAQPDRRGDWRFPLPIPDAALRTGQGAVARPRAGCSARSR
jgi:hypothetical protein